MNKSQRERRKQADLFAQAAESATDVERTFRRLGQRSREPARLRNFWRRMSNNNQYAYKRRED